MYTLRRQVLDLPYLPTNSMCLRLSLFFFILSIHAHHLNYISTRI